jgi:hypothetical protein
MCAKVFKGNFLILINVVVMYHGLLSKLIEHVIDLRLLLDIVAIVMKRPKIEVIFLVSMSQKHLTSMDFFLQVLPFLVFFQEIVYNNVDNS